MSEKKTCHRCSGKGYNMRTVVIGTVVTMVRDSCYTCRGTGKVDK
jgi:DnaJ-class molecular chaperone